MLIMQLEFSILIGICCNLNNIMSLWSHFRIDPINTYIHSTPCKHRPECYYPPSKDMQLLFMYCVLVIPTMYISMCIYYQSTRENILSCSIFYTTFKTFYGDLIHQGRVVLGDFSMGCSPIKRIKKVPMTDHKYSFMVYYCLEFSGKSSEILYHVCP